MNQLGRHSIPTHEAANPPPSRDTLQEKLDTLKRKANFESKCANVSAYVDDCQMDGAKSLRKVLWASLPLHFESDDPAETQRVLRNGQTGRSDSSNPGARFISHLSHAV